MRYLRFLQIFVTLVIVTPISVQSQDLEVFAITREMGPIHDGAKRQKAKGEFEGEKVFIVDSTLSLEGVSTSYYSDFYIFNWQDDYNLLIERCIGRKNCDSFIVQHYEKGKKGLQFKKSKTKYLKIPYDEYGLTGSNCKDLFRFTIEKEEKNDIEYPEDTVDAYLLPQYDEKRIVLKRFYVYFCD
jgi:hypothetical protein